MIQKVVIPILAWICNFLWLVSECHIPQYDEDQVGGTYNFDVEYIHVKDRPLFIDKTPFVKHFYTKNRLMVIHAPPNFGKTSNLKMLEMFFEIPVDGAGTIQQNFIYEKRQFFDTLLICKDANSFFCMEHISSHSVISLDFNELEVEDLESFCVSFREMISNLFQNHEYLGRSRFLGTEERKIFDDELHPRGHPLLRDGTYALGGRHLSELLYKHFNRTCIVLIDNYDAPASKLILEGNKDDSSGEIFKVLTDLITGLLKGNKYVSHSLLTGISNIGSVYTQTVTDLKYHSVFEDKALSEFYGFRFKDLEDLVWRFARQAQLEEARRMYEGYHVLGTNEKLTNIYSFSKFLEIKGVGDFKPIPALKLLPKLFEYGKLGRTVEDTFEKSIHIQRKLTFFTKSDVKNLHDLIYKQNVKIPTDTENLMLQFLQENGCYSIISKNEDMCKAEITIPNLEVKNILKGLVYTDKFFVEKYKIPTERLKNYAQSVVKLNRTEASFQVMMSAVRALFEKVAPETEFQFQAPLFSLPKLMSNESILEVNDGVFAPNKTKIDALMVRKDGTCIMFAFRFNRDSSFAALQEMVNNKHYEVKTKHSDTVRKKMLVGLHFNKYRDCSVSYLQNNFDIANAINVTSNN